MNIEFLTAAEEELAAAAEYYERQQIGLGARLTARRPEYWLGRAGR